MNKPNIVFYFSDQQRADTAGCYGQSLPVTPNLDAFAQDATLYENAFLGEKYYRIKHKIRTEMEEE